MMYDEFVSLCQHKVTLWTYHHIIEPDYMNDATSKNKQEYCERLNKLTKTEFLEKIIKMACTEISALRDECAKEQKSNRELKRELEIAQNDYTWDLQLA